MLTPAAPHSLASVASAPGRSGSVNRALHNMGSPSVVVVLVSGPQRGWSRVAGRGPACFVEEKPAVPHRGPAQWAHCVPDPRADRAPHRLDRRGRGGPRALPLGDVAAASRRGGLLAGGPELAARTRGQRLRPLLRRPAARDHRADPAHRLAGRPLHAARGGRRRDLRVRAGGRGRRPAPRRRGRTGPRPCRPGGGVDGRGRGRTGVQRRRRRRLRQGRAPRHPAGRRRLLAGAAGPGAPLDPARPGRRACWRCSPSASSRAWSAAWSSARVLLVAGALADRGAVAHPPPAGGRRGPRGRRAGRGHRGVGAGGRRRPRHPVVRRGRLPARRRRGAGRPAERHHRRAGRAMRELAVETGMALLARLVRAAPAPPGPSPPGADRGRDGDARSSTRSRWCRAAATGRRTSSRWCRRWRWPPPWC